MCTISRIYYKFKNTNIDDEVIFQGSGLKLRCLRDNIMRKNCLNKKRSKLEITDEQTKRVFTDDEEIIERFSSVIVRRLPAYQGPFENEYRDLSNRCKRRPATAMSNDQFLNSRKMLEPKYKLIDENIKRQGEVTKSVNKVPPVKNADNINKIPVNNVNRGNKQLPLVNWRPYNRNDYKLINKKPPSAQRPASAYMNNTQMRPFSALENPSHSNESKKETIPENIICPLCRKIFTKPYRTPCCLKSYCHLCIINYLNDPEVDGMQMCPNCSNKIGTGSYLIPDASTENEIYVYNTVLKPRRTGANDSGKTALINMTSEQRVAYFINYLQNNPEIAEKVKEAGALGEDHVRRVFMEYKNKMCPELSSEIPEVIENDPIVESRKRPRPNPNPIPKVSSSIRQVWPLKASSNQDSKSKRRKYSDSKKSGSPSKHGSSSTRGSLGGNKSPSTRGSLGGNKSPSRRGSLGRNKSPSKHGSTSRRGSLGRNKSPSKHGSPSTRGSLGGNKSPSRRGSLGGNKSPSRRGSPSICSSGRGSWISVKRGGRHYAPDRIRKRNPIRHGGHHNMRGNQNRSRSPVRRGHQNIRGGLGRNKSPSKHGSPSTRGSLGGNKCPSRRGSPSKHGSPSTRRSLGRNRSPSKHGSPSTRGSLGGNKCPSRCGSPSKHGSPSTRRSLGGNKRPSRRGSPSICSSRRGSWITVKRGGKHHAPDRIRNRNPIRHGGHHNMRGNQNRSRSPVRRGHQNIRGHQSRCESPNRGGSPRRSRGSNRSRSPHRDGRDHQERPEDRTNCMNLLAAIIDSPTKCGEKRKSKSGSWISVKRGGRHYAPDRLRRCRNRSQNNINNFIKHQAREKYRSKSEFSQYKDEKGNIGLSDKEQSELKSELRNVVIDVLYNEKEKDEKMPIEEDKSTIIDINKDGDGNKGTNKYENENFKCDNIDNQNIFW